MGAIAIFGATSTLAQAIAERYVSTDASLILVGRSREKLAAVANHLTCLNGKLAVETISADFENLAALREVVEQIFAKPVPPSMAIICHGVLLSNAECLADEKAFLENTMVNFTSTAYLAEKLGTALANKTGGTLVVVTSVAGDRGRQSNFCYGATKAAVSAYLDGLRASLASKNVSVLEVKPGVMDSAMTAHLPLSPLMASPQKVAGDILNAVHRRKRRIYSPWFWKIIMTGLKTLPDAVWAKVKF
ncbi:MAG TPA: SDR family NAD(P)-dependent oxidoreductase [Verrucomicrobiae bacterium]|jgi:short-subunit dehydrogenase|nr:SDR family NAD(P)-dependent oxidoreductase [Verrucomicrobiae bacterium]